MPPITDKQSFMKLYPIESKYAASNWKGAGLAALSANSILDLNSQFAKIEHELINKTNWTFSTDIFENIDTSWKRVPNAASFTEQIERIESDYKISNPAASVPDLIELYRDEKFDSSAESNEKGWLKIKDSINAPDLINLKNNIRLLN